MVKYFTSRIIHFLTPEAIKIKPKSEIFYNITLTSVTSCLFYPRYLHTVFLYFRTLTINLAKGFPKPLAVILAAVLTRLSRLHQRIVAVKTRKSDELDWLP